MEYVAEHSEGQGFVVAGTEVSVRTEAGVMRVDLVLFRWVDGKKQFRWIEAKNGPRARPSNAQLEKWESFFVHGGTLIGTNGSTILNTYLGIGYEFGPGKGYVDVNHAPNVEPEIDIPPQAL